MIRIRFEIRTKEAVRKVFCGRPESFVTVEAAQKFADQNQSWLTKPEIVQVDYRTLRTRDASGVWY